MVLTAGGFYIAYIYLHGIDNGTSPLLLIPSILFIAGGIFFLIQASKSNASVIAKGGEMPQPQSKETLADILERNSQIINQWEKNSQMRDKLKVVQTAVKAAEKPHL